MQSSFYRQLDQLYADHPHGVEDFLLSALAEFQQQEDWEGAAAASNELGSLYRGQTRYEESAAAFQQTLDRLEAMGQKNSVAYLTALLNRAGTYRLDGRAEEAVSDFQSVLTLLEGKTGESVPYIRASALNNLGLTYESLGQLEQAKTCAVEAMDQIRSQPGTEAEVASSQNNLATICLRQDRLEEAETWIARAMPYYESAAARQDPHLANAYATLAAIRCRQDRLAEALTAYDKAAEEMERFFGRNLNTASLWFNGALTAGGLHRPDAMERLRRAEALYRQLQGPDGPMTRRAEEVRRQWEDAT